MKKINKIIMIMAAAAMTFTACSDDDAAIQNNNDRRLVFSVGSTESRTELGTNDAGGLIPLWSPGDKLSLQYKNQAQAFPLSSNLVAPAPTCVFSSNAGQSVDALTQDMKAKNAQCYYLTTDNLTEFNDPACPDDIMFKGNVVPTYAKRVGTFGDGSDFLISDPMQPSALYNPGETSILPANMNRMMAVIELHIVDRTTNADFIDYNAQEVILSATSIIALQPNNEFEYSTPNFGGGFTYNPVTKVINRIKGECNYAYLMTDENTVFANEDETKHGLIKAAREANLNGDGRPAQEGYPAYICCLPIEIEKDGTLSLMIYNKDVLKYVRKICEFPNGLKIEAGKVTKLKAYIGDYDKIEIM